MITQISKKDLHTNTEEDNKGVGCALSLSPTTMLEHKVRVKGEKVSSFNESFNESAKLQPN